jgi:ribose 5-phosphate isomerase RpiB
MTHAANNPGSRKFITADDLRERLAQAGKGVVDLAANESLTPAAADVVDQMGLVVRQLVEAAPLYVPTVKITPPAKQAIKTLTTGTKPTGRATVGAVGLVIHEPDAQVESLLGSMRYDGTTFVDCSKTECWILNLECLAEQITMGPAVVGVLIAPYAADVMAVAGKMRGIRPVQGTSDAAVAGAMRHYDANLLVIGYRDSGFGQMRAMIRTFTAARTPLPVADIMKAIERHERA